MIPHLSLIFLALILYEFFKKVKFMEILRANTLVYRKLLTLMAYKRVSDDWKEKALFGYSRDLLTSSTKILLTLALVILLAVFFNLLVDGFMALVFSLAGIIEASLVLFIYDRARKKMDAKL